jgi:hypothetical protein
MKNIRIVGIVIISFLITTASTCAKNKANCHYYYTMKNNSSAPFYFGFAFDSSLLRLSYNPASSPAEFKCDMHDEKSDRINRCYEGDLNYFGKMYIFIFDTNVLETTPWDTVKKNYIILKKYELTKAQLDSADWYINYP